MRVPFITAIAHIKLQEHFLSQYIHGIEILCRKVVRAHVSSELPIHWNMTLISKQIHGVFSTVTDNSRRCSTAGLLTSLLSTWGEDNPSPSDGQESPDAI